MKSTNISELYFVFLPKIYDMILVNDTARDSEGFSEKILETGLSIYEVIRIFNKKPIFLCDNLLRLDNSLKKSNIRLDPSDLHLSDKLEHLIRLEHIEEGNVKYVLHFTEGRMTEYLYTIPHSYPSAVAYRNGVDTMTCRAVRENPEVKYLNPALRNLTDRLMQENGVYEIILVDDEGYVTEGSRSNVFFIREHTLYTTPGAYVLPGTSRKRVFDICKAEKIGLEEKRISADTLSRYEAAFITGTSPLILPIRRIDAVSFHPDHPLLRRLMRSYFALLEKTD